LRTKGRPYSEVDKKVASTRQLQAKSRHYSEADDTAAAASTHQLRAINQALF
jgi:hypothetical protein